MTAAAHRPRFWTSFGFGALIVLAAAGLTYGLHRGGFFERWENDQNIDRWLRFKEQRPHMSKYLTLVLIDDADYKSAFKGASPLDAQRVLDVIEAIHQGNPKVIGVDLDTTHWTEKDAARASKIPNVVWARDGWEERGKLEMENLLGGFYGEQTCFGLPAVQVDDDGVVRRYSQSYPVGDRILPAFPEAVAAIAERKPCPEAEPAAKVPAESGEGGIRINFLGQGLAFPRLPSSAVVQLAKTSEWRSHSDVEGRTVLLGGVFRAARDRYVTPVGLMDGVAIIAHIVESELSGDKIREADHELHLLADIALGLVLVTIFYFVEGWWKLAVILIAVSLVILVSFWLLQSTAYFFSFVPVLGGVLLHEFIESVVENKKLRDELKAREI
jgi:CHASE2 domain-containing sensor protein